VKSRVAAMLACFAVVVHAGAARSQTDWRRAALDSFDVTWQTVADTAYDQTFGGNDWNAIRTELRPKVEAAASPDEARAVIRTMLSRLGQSHFALLTATGFDDGATAERAGGSPGATEVVAPVTLGNLPPLAVRTDVREVHTQAGRRVGVIAFNYWMPSIDGPVSEAVDRFRNADGIVLDLRGNPGGLAAMMSGIAGHFIDDERPLLGQMRTRDAQLEFHPNPRRATGDGRRVTPYAGPLALLVNEKTASTSECFAGALQSLGRARVFGRNTMGQALPAMTKRLASGDVLMYAVGTFVTSSGHALERDGVLPDEVVSLSGGATDAILDAALRWFDGTGR
jgi:C-terminal processing protease CtpA/Prc